MTKLVQRPPAATEQKPVLQYELYTSKLSAAVPSGLPAYGSVQKVPSPPQVPTVSVSGVVQ